MAVILGHWQLRGYGLWAAELKETGALVGRIGLHDPEGWPAFEVGWLIDKAQWGRGLATEGGAAAIDFAFQRLNRPHVASLIRPGNAASIRVAEKLGMKLERTRRFSRRRRAHLWPRPARLRSWRARSARPSCPD